MLGYVLDSVHNEYVCGDQGTWEVTEATSDTGVWVTHQGRDVTSPKCGPVTCDQPPMVDHSVLELVNGSTGLHSLLVYTCEAGYYDQQYPQSITVSTCQSDSTWSEVNLRLVEKQLETRLPASRSSSVRPKGCFLCCHPKVKGGGSVI